MLKNEVLSCGRVLPSNIKSSLRELVVYYNEFDLKVIGEGYIKESLDILSDVSLYTDVRYFLETDYTKRHPIPYALLKYKDRYFLADRLKGGTEVRLHGKKGMLGGHVDASDLDSSKGTVALYENALMRELSEEVGVTYDKVSKIDFKGYIRIVDEGAVEGVHLGLVYIVDLNTDDISSAEEHILKGSWYTKSEIVDLYSTLERWSALVIENEVLKK